MKDEAPRHTWAIEVPARLRDWCSAHCHQRLLLDRTHDDHMRISVGQLLLCVKPQPLASDSYLARASRTAAWWRSPERPSAGHTASRKTVREIGADTAQRGSWYCWGTVGDSSRFEPQQRLEDHLAIDTASDHGCIIALVVGEGIALGPRLDRFGATRSMRLHHHSKHQSSPSGCSRKHKHASIPAQQWVRSKQWRLRECREYASACQYRMPTYQSVDPNNRANQTSSE